MGNDTPIQSNNIRVVGFPVISRIVRVPYQLYKRRKKKGASFVLENGQNINRQEKAGFRIRSNPERVATVLVTFSFYVFFFFSSKNDGRQA